MLRKSFASLLLVFLLFAPPPIQAQMSRASTPERVLSAEQFREGVRLVHRTMIERSPAPYHAFARERIDAEVARLLGRSSPLTEGEAFIALSRLVGMLRGGHSWVSLDDDTQLFSRSVPLRFWRFSDGIYVRAAAPEFSALVGARLLAVNGVPIDAAWARILDGVGDGGQIAEGRAPIYAGMPDFLRALGIGRSNSEIDFVFRLASGREMRRTIPARQYRTYSEAYYAAQGWTTPAGWVEPEGARRARWYARRNDAFWYEYWPDNGTIYAQFNIATTDPDNPFDPVNDRLRPMLLEVFARASQPDVNRLIIDLRNNNGGNSALWQPIVHGIVRTARLSEPGRLFVVVGRLTESAAVAWATRIEGNSRAIFVGEPTASPPNFFNDPAGPRRERFNVPGSAINFRIANMREYWSDSEDDRAAIYPDLPVSLSWADFSSGRDPDLEAILRVEPAAADAFFVDGDGDPIRPTSLWRNFRRRSQIEVGQIEPRP